MEKENPGKDNLENFVSQLQVQILEEVRSAYGPVAYERWQSPKFEGSLEDPDGYARMTGPCGDTMEIFLKFEKERVKAASFQTDGCGPSGVCGSFAAEMALGREPDELLEVTGEAIMEVLGGLPADERHCAYLAASTLQAALDSYMLKHEKDKDPA